MFSRDSMTTDLAHGLLLQDQGRLEEAESRFHNVLAEEPENDFVYGRLALCQLNQQGKKREALESIDTAIRIRSDESFYHSVRSLILSDMRKGKEALETADRAVALNPEDGLALASKANAYCSLEHWHEGEEWSLRALAADPDQAMASNILSHTLRLQGKKKESALVAKKLLEADPEDSFAHANAGWSALHRGESAQAEEHFREALRLDPDSEPAREGLIESFKARSWFYRCYLSYSFFMQRFNVKSQWVILIGFFVVYQIMIRVTERVNPMVAGTLVAGWLGFVLWVWLASGIGNFLVMLDRKARLALKPQEVRQGVAVGGGLILGLVASVAGVCLGNDPILLAGIGIIASTVPASLAFGNESRSGRYVFGAITALVYLTTVSIFLVECLRYPADSLSSLTLTLGMTALIATVLCTWLGNIRSLRCGDPS